MIKLKILPVVGLFVAGLLLSSGANAQNDPLSHKFSYGANKTSVHWYTGAWSTCGGPNPCDYGEQTRLVECHDNMNNVRPDADCLALTAKPIEVQQCDLPSCSWQPTPWGPCSAGQTNDPDIDVDVNGSAENVERFINEEFQYDECNPAP
jgi:hypothetical protein